MEEELVRFRRTEPGRSKLFLERLRNEEVTERRTRYNSSSFFSRVVQPSSDGRGVILRSPKNFFFCHHSHLLIVWSCSTRYCESHFIPRNSVGLKMFIIPLIYLLPDLTFVCYIVLFSVNQDLPYNFGCNNFNTTVQPNLSIFKFT